MTNPEWAGILTLSNGALATFICLGLYLHALSRSSPESVTFGPADDDIKEAAFGGSLMALPCFLALGGLGHFEQVSATWAEAFGAALVFFVPVGIVITLLLTKVSRSFGDRWYYVRDSKRSLFLLWTSLTLLGIGLTISATVAGVVYKYCPVDGPIVTIGVGV